MPSDPTKNMGPSMASFALHLGAGDPQEVSPRPPLDSAAGTSRWSSEPPSVPPRHWAPHAREPAGSKRVSMLAVGPPQVCHRSP